MRDTKHSLLFELGADHRLQHPICLTVDGRSSLIEHQDLRTEQQSSPDTYKLPLPYGEVPTPLLHLLQELLLEALNHLCHLDFLKHGPQLIVVMLPERVQIIPHSAHEEHGVLRDYPHS